MPPGTIRSLTWMTAHRPGASTRSSSGVRKSICCQKCWLDSVWPKSLYDGVYSYWVENRDAGDDQVHSAAGHRHGLFDSVAVDEPVAVAGDFVPPHTSRAGECRRHGFAGQPVGADDLAHAGGELVVLPPFPLELGADPAFGFGVDQVDPDRLGLQEPMDAVDGPDEVSELEADPGEDRAVAVPLEVAPGPGDDRLGGEVLDLAVGEVDDRLLAFVEVLAAPHADRFGDRGRDRVPLGLKVVPEQEVCGGVFGDELGQLGGPAGDARPDGLVTRCPCCWAAVQMHRGTSAPLPRRSRCRLSGGRRSPEHDVAEPPGDDTGRADRVAPC